MDEIENMNFNHFDWTSPLCKLHLQPNIMDEVQSLPSKIYSRPKTLIITCWRADPLRRPTFDVIKRRRSMHLFLHALGEKSSYRSPVLEFQATWMCLPHSPHIRLLESILL